MTNVLLLNFESAESRAAHPQIQYAADHEDVVAYCLSFRCRWFSLDTRVCHRHTGKYENCSCVVELSWRHQFASVRLEENAYSIMHPGGSGKVAVGGL